MTEHWRHETVTALVSSIEAVEFNDKERAINQIKLALSYVDDDEFSWKCTECENPLIDCECTASQNTEEGEQE